MSMTRRGALDAVLCGVAGAAVRWGPLRAEGDISDRERAQMRTIAEAFATRYGVPGLSVAIAAHGRLAYDECLGFADRERGERLTTRHRFRIASVSKPLTATAIFALIEDGRLSLTDKIFGRGAILGTSYGTKPYGRYVETITIEHLLTHTCGGWQNDGRDPMFRNPTMSHAELISWTLDTETLTQPPGQSYAYSNFGYCLLGRVIEAVTNQPYEAWVRDHVLRRCGVENMTITGNTLAERQAREVRYYGQAGEDPYAMNVRRMDAHGGWVGSASDLATFATYVDGFDTPRDVLSSSTIRRMTTPSAAAADYACGWSVNRANNWWHGGSLPGTTTIIVRTSSGFCWAALANTRRPRSDISLALDNMVWDMARQVSAWRP